MYFSPSKYWWQMSKRHRPAQMGRPSEMRITLCSQIHFSIAAYNSPFVSHFSKMPMQCSEYAKHLLSHSPCRRQRICLSSEIQMIKKIIQDERVSKCIVFCAWVLFFKLWKNKVVRKQDFLLHSDLSTVLAQTLLWHVRTKVILYGANRPVGELLLWQVEADAA